MPQCGIFQSQLWRRAHRNGGPLLISEKQTQRVCQCRIL